MQNLSSGLMNVMHIHHGKQWIKDEERFIEI